MLKRNSKSITGLILVIALVFSMFPTLPSSVAHAAVTNLLPSTLTLNGNIKASSQNSTRTAANIGNIITWTQGANTVYSASGSNLWVAIDLGSSSDIEGFNFHTTAIDTNTINRSSQYEVSYSNDISPSSPWNKLSTTPSNSAITFSPTANGWTSAAVVPTNILTGTLANGTYSWSSDPSINSGYYTSNLTFTTPITARYILINYTLKPSATGQLGIGLLQIIPPVTLSSSSGIFYKTLQNTLSTQINLDTATSFTGITNGLYTLMQGTDYTFDANSNVVTFSNTYLSSLNGSYNLSFKFSSSSLPYALTVAAAADSSLSSQGAIYIPASPSVISTTMSLNSNTFTNISKGATILTSEDYVKSGDTVTFNQSYLNTLSMGVHSFFFNFNQGNPQTYMLTISGKPPVANIDYRYWTLQEPLPGGAGQTSQALQAGYADPYFYVGADGSQVFMDTAVGGTTSGSAHPRSELREYDPIAGTDAGWLPVGANAMTNTVAVTTLGTSNGVGWTTIGQVFDTETTTLCELEYGYDPTRPNSNIRILYEPSGINSLGYQYLPIKIPLNQYFTYRMTLNDQVLSVYLNGALIFNGQTASPSQVIPPNHQYYFKAGNYDQTATNGNVNYVPYTVVQFKSISVYHAPTVSSNADLSSLTLSSGTLNPAFASGTPAYTSNVANGVSSITVTSSVYDSNAMVTVNGAPVISGQASSAINLNVGSNVIPIVVTALNGTTKTYSITVNRAAPSSNADLSYLTLSSGTLSPAFASGTTTYASTVASGVSSITVTSSVYDSNATMTVNGTPVVSGQASGAIGLNLGSNIITIAVTAQNGTTKTYSITVNRAAAPSSNADLNSLTLSSGILSPAFVSGTMEYASTVASGVSSITVTASVYDSNATMTVNGTPIISGQASGAISLNLGSNTITIAVTAQNGTTKTYSITVNRAAAPSSNTDLNSLTLSSGILSPAFVSGTTAYTSNVASGVSSITVTSSVYDSNATMTVNGTPVISGQASGAISLNTGSNTITIVVTAQNGTTKTYTINVLRLQSNSSSNSSSTGSSSGGGAGTSPTQVGQATPINTEVKTVGGKSVAQAKVDDKIIDTALKASVNGNIILAADSNVKADQINVSFNSGALQKITKDDKAKLLTVETQLGNYELPVKQINLQDLAAKLGVSIENVNLEIHVSLNDSAADKAKASGQRVLAVADFTVKATSSDGKSIEVSIFSQYVRRTLKTEASLNTRNLAAVRVQTDNQGITTYQPVPFTVNGKEISLYSRTNSTYMLLENNTTFADIKNHWAKDEIESMTNKFIVQGVTKDEFQPDQAVTRAEFAALIARTIGLTSETSSKIKFTDVRSNDWFEGQAYAATEAGIVTGYDDQTFRPNQPISREEMAVMIYRAMKFAGFDDAGAVQKVTFTDDNLFENWAKEAISVMADKKIVEGVASNKYDPKATAATRAQSAVILQRMLAKLSFTN
ncbi:cadherin-like beta sandwich domain-containing protein [Paenibacillus periandrae]|uniref:cadherin-like beta sandwich domain-containing protein n=1 Tax=Paenibacillus periandrae TaxID=1761741 RepID=UPI001F09705E|nr:cadherin-like beta sandwich domain-containing protein [Paenibacillus periandrae]